MTEPHQFEGAVAMRLCPVCSTSIAGPNGARFDLTVYLYGSLYVMMCPRCKTELLRDPGKYLRSREGAFEAALCENPRPLSTATIDPKVDISKTSEVDAEMATVRDPVCGMDIDPETAAATAGLEGRTYHFCSQRCHDKFVAAPRYVIKGDCVNSARGGKGLSDASNQ